MPPRPRARSKLGQRHPAEPQEPDEAEREPASGDRQQASLPASNVGNQQASLPARENGDNQTSQHDDNHHDSQPAATDTEPPDKHNTSEANTAPADTAASGMQWGVAELVGGIDPEEDRHQSGLRLPKYVFEALRLRAVLTRQKQQVIAAEAVKAYLPPELLDETYRRLYGRERPPM